MHFTSVVSTLALGLTVASAATIQSIDAFKVPVDGSAPSTNETEPLYVFIAGEKYKFVSGSPPPSSGAVCPETDNGNNRNYPSHTYTKNQLTAAFNTGGEAQANGKSVGENDYPHAFGNREIFDFPPCSNNDLEEFPIQTNGQTYSGGDVSTIPDRLIYSYKIQKNILTAYYCGVIRHGPNNNFLQCSD